MKVLFIGYYREGSGWGHATRNYILALDRVGIDVVPRCINISNDDFDLPKRILELEKKNAKNCDVVIQKLLPHHMCYDGHFEKNIGLFVLESSNFKSTAWTNYINMMDENWVPCKHNLESCLNSDIYKPVYVIPEPYDDKKFEFGYEPLELPGMNEKFIFYFIGENTRRKNLAALIQAFHLEFSPVEPVELLIKTRTPGIPEEQQSSHIINFISGVKQGLKIYQNLDYYKKECLIIARVSDDDIMRIHATGHCFVMPSCGEAWAVPVADAMAFGNPVLANNCGGMRDQIENIGGGILINNREVPCVGAMDTFPDLYTSREKWYAIDVSDLRQQMRRIYENKEVRKMLSQNGINNSHIYNYESVGKIMKSRLEAL